MLLLSELESWGWRVIAFFFSQEAATEAAHEAAFLKALSQQADAEFQSLSTTPKSHWEASWICVACQCDLHENNDDEWKFVTFVEFVSCQKLYLHAHTYEHTHARTHTHTIHTHPSGIASFFFFVAVVTGIVQEYYEKKNFLSLYPPPPPPSFRLIIKRNETDLLP